MDKSITKEFDERQERVRGIGYKYGFFTLLICNALYAFSDSMLNRPIFDTITGIALGVSISATVHVSYCIWHDGYFSMNSNQNRTLITLFVLGGFNLCLGIMSIFHGDIIVDGIITYHSSNLICALMFLIIFFVLWLKQKTQTIEE